MRNENYLTELANLFKKHGIKAVYANCRFVPRPMRNPVLYTSGKLDAEAKKEIQDYLTSTSLDRSGSFSFNSLTAPHKEDMIYKNGEFLIKERVEVFS